MNSPQKALIALVLALAAMMDYAMGADESATDTVWHLNSDAKVDSSGIFLTDLVNPTPPVVLPQIRLAPAPPPGQTTFLSRSQIISLASNALPEIVSTNWTGPARARISRRMKNLGEMELTAILQSALQSNYVRDSGELELHFSEAWKEIPVPDEPLTLTVTEMPSSGVMPTFVAGFELRTANERVGRWQSLLSAKVWHDVTVSRSLLTKGQLLSEADTMTDRRDVLTIHDVLINPGDNNNLELTQSVPAGNPILNRFVRPRPLIRRGQMVDAVFEDGSLKISLKVESLEDGVQGQMVRLRNPRTSRELYGKVQNEESVSISL